MDFTIQHDRNVLMQLVCRGKLHWGDPLRASDVLCLGHKGTPVQPVTWATGYIHFYIYISVLLQHTELIVWKCIQVSALSRILRWCCGKVYCKAPASLASAHIQLGLQQKLPTHCCPNMTSG